MSRSVRAGAALVFALGTLGASASPAGAVEPRTEVARYDGFTVVERTACNKLTDVGMACFDLADTDTHIDVTIADDYADNVMGVLSYHYANGESMYQPRFCNVGSFDILLDIRGAPAYLVVSVEPHGFAGGCTFHPADLPVTGTITVTVR